MDRFLSLMAMLKAEERGSRWHFDCPLCGADEFGRNGSVLYHCYCYFNEKAEKVFVQCHICQTHLPLERFVARRAERLGIIDDSDAYVAIDAPMQRDERPDPPWKNDAGFVERWNAYVDRDAANIARIWTENYKPITEETVRRERLGHMAFPYWNGKEWVRGYTPRLAVPLFRDGLIVGFRGRAYKDGKRDWQTAAKSDPVLMGIDRVQEGSRVVLCENVIDRLLLQQAYPDIVGLASGGLIFYDAWINELKARRPRTVMVWLDHDLSGNGSRHHAAQFEAEWRERVIAKRKEKGIMHLDNMPKPPSPAGIAIVNRMLAAKLKARLYAWERGQPRGADLGHFLLTKEPYYATPLSLGQ